MTWRQWLEAWLWRAGYVVVARSVLDLVERFEAGDELDDDELGIIADATRQRPRTWLH